MYTYNDKHSWQRSSNCVCRVHFESLTTQVLLLLVGLPMWLDVAMPAAQRACQHVYALHADIHQLTPHIIPPSGSMYAYGFF